MVALRPIELLYEERDALEALLRLLQHEQTRLVEADFDALVTVTGEKAGIVSRMSELAKSRHHWLAAAGFDPDETGMRAWLEQSPAPNVMEAWAGTLSLARAAKELNRVNGLLIGKHMSRSQQLLHVLIGQCGSGMIYGPDGQSKVIPALRSLVVS